jgi:sugar lactone lactonase YvrE
MNRSCTPWSVARLAVFFTAAFFTAVFFSGSGLGQEVDLGYSNPKLFQHWLWSTAHRIPAELTSEESGYFSIVEGLDGHIYVGTAKYGDNAFLVDFDPQTKRIHAVVDAEKEMGVDRKGFAAQAKIHTRNNVGKSGKIYFGTKQGYLQKEGEKRSDYLGGRPMVYDPATKTTRVYDIPVKHQGVISVTPDEARGVAYISTCSDERPIESTHFLTLNLKTGEYRDLMDCRHMYAFIVIDHLGRAYHPILGGDIARYDPSSGKLDRLKQSIDGEPPTRASLLADPKSHPINWEVSPDRRTLYAVAMSGNQLYAYDLTDSGDTLSGRSLGPLSPNADKTDCRALCVGNDSVVWAGVAVTRKDLGKFLHITSYRPGDNAPADHGPIAIGNPDYAQLKDASGKTKKHHHGAYRLDDGTLVPRYVIMGICAARDGVVYVTTLYPFTVHAIRIPKVAGVTTEYRYNAHADVLLSRLIETDTLDGKGDLASIRLASLYTDQVPDNDTSRKFAKQYGFPIFPTVGETLTNESGTELAVDGVMLVAEHGKYSRSDTGQIQYPKRRLFSEIVETFKATGQVAPVFSDKHLGDNWRDAKWIYDTAKKMKIPLMAGSSLPVLWRYPPTDVKRGAKLKEIVAISYHTLDAYGFHAMEMVQVLAERRAGGETGIQSVQCISGDDVWEAGKRGVYDRRLLDSCLARLERRPLRQGKTVEELTRDPVLFVIDYRDGLRANVLTLNGAVVEWAAAWQYADSEETDSTLFWTQEARPYHHFNYLLQGVEQMMHTGQPTWPVERTLLTSGALDALLISKRDGGKKLETPWLDVKYKSQWDWRQPPQPPGKQTAPPK